MASVPNNAKLAVQLARSAVRRAKAGHCGAAQGDMVRAEILFGAFDSHRYGMRATRGMRVGKIVRDASETVGEICQRRTLGSFPF
jgi:hypothetical protein